MTRLAAVCGRTENAIYKIYAGINGCTTEMAVLFEAATGVNRRQWAWPEDYGNPWDTWRRKGFRFLTMDAQATISARRNAAVA